MNLGLSNWQVAWLISGLILFSSALSLIYAPDVSDSTIRVDSKDYLYQILNFPLYFFVLYFVFINKHSVFRKLLEHKVLLGLLILPIVSVSWSLEYISTLTKSIFLILTILLSVALHVCANRDQIFRCIVIFFLVAGLITLIAPIISFSTAIHQDSHYPALRGFFRHKNIPGRLFVLGIAFSLYYYLMTKSNISLYSVLVSSLVVLLTLSGTSLILMFVIYFVFFGLSVIKFNRRFSLVVFIILFVVSPLLLFLMVYSEFYLTIFDALGKDPTLTGRATIWEVIWWDVFPYKPWLGYGYEGFWSSFEGAFWVDWGMYAYVPPHAHNAVLHTLVNLGVVGLVFLLFFVFKFIFRSCRRFLLTGDYFSILCVALSVYIVVVNFTEVVLWQNSIIWFLLVYCYLELVSVRDRYVRQ